MIPSARIGRVTLGVAAALLAAGAAQAQVYKCPGPGGRIEYSGKPCPGTGKELASTLPTSGSCEAVATRLRKLREELDGVNARLAALPVGASPERTSGMQRAADLRADIAGYERQGRGQGCGRPERQAELRDCEALREKFLYYTAGDGRQEAASGQKHPVFAVIAEMKRKGCDAP